MSANTFADLLLAGESLLCTLESPGPAVGVAGGLEECRWMVGLTPQRILIIKLIKPPRSKGWVPAGRMAVGRETVRLSQFTRTPQSSARLVIDGAGEQVVCLDVDQEIYYASFQNFLRTWNGPVTGQPIPPGWTTSTIDVGAGDTKMLWYLVGAMAAFTVICCGCGALLGVIRGLLVVAEGM